MPNTVLDNYRLWSSNHLQRAVAGFAFLRRRGLVDSSKFLIRPAIEMMIRVEAARQHRDLFYRIAHAEHRQDKHLLRIADEHQLQAYDGAQSEKIWEQFSDAFKKDFPTIPIPNVDERLTIEYLAESGLAGPGAPFGNGIAIKNREADQRTLRRRPGSRRVGLMLRGEFF